jgi:hypothetical protein
MKFLFSIGLSLFLFLQLNAQCGTALPDDIFSQLHAAVAGLQSGREQTAKDISSSNCLSSNQIGLFTALLANDQEKYNYLTFAKPYCADPKNYINLASHISDARLKKMFQNSVVEQNTQNLNQQSTVLPTQPELQVQPVQTTVQTQNIQTQPVQNQALTITAPAQLQPQSVMHSPIKGYSGRVGCENIISDEAFWALEQNLNKQSFESDKISLLKQQLSAYCISTAQLSRVLKMFVHESNKIDAAKFALAYVHDLDNFPNLSGEFGFKSSQQELLNYFNSNSAKFTKKTAVSESSNYQGTKGCNAAMSSSEFTNLLKAAKLETFDSKRTETINNSLSQNCLSVDQIEKLAQLYSFDNHKLDFLKIAYGKTFDKDNFGKLESLFSFDSYKRDFNNIMKGGKMGK